MPIPPFDGISNVLPPCSTDGGKVREISPYLSTIEEFVDRFSTSAARKALLLRLLDFRAELYRLGIDGFQWLDGSFVENIEMQAQRDPKDIDAVTFVRKPPDGSDFERIARENGIWFPRQVKNTYGIDNFWVHLALRPDNLVKVATFWHGLFTHRRSDQLWKGMVTVSIFDKGADDRARQRLSSEP